MVSVHGIVELDRNILAARSLTLVWSHGSPLTICMSCRVALLTTSTIGGDIGFVAVVVTKRV